MGQAVPGDGEIRKKLDTCSKKVEENIQEFFHLVMSDEARTRNNLDVPSSTALLESISRQQDALNSIKPVVERAREHHLAQKSVMRSDFLGRRRRIKDGTPILVDEVDMDHFPELAKKHGFNNMKPHQKDRFTKAAFNPSPEWTNCENPEVQKDWIFTGSWNPIDNL